VAEQKALVDSAHKSTGGPSVPQGPRDGLDVIAVIHDRVGHGGCDEIQADVDVFVGEDVPQAGRRCEPIRQFRRDQSRGGCGGKGIPVGRRSPAPMSRTLNEHYRCGSIHQLHEDAFDRVSCEPFGA